MEPLDTAFNKFCKFIESIGADYWSSLQTEADVRMKLIDPIFTGILGWPMEEIHLENSGDSGRIDYRLTIKQRSRLIVEAKRKGRDLGISESHAARYFKLNGSVFQTEASQEAIKQLIGYCGTESAELACATNGRQWFVFRGNRLADGQKIVDGMACVFGSLDAVKAKFQMFYNLLSFDAVNEHTFRAFFSRSRGSADPHFDVSITHPTLRFAENAACKSFVVRPRPNHGFILPRHNRRR